VYLWRLHKKGNEVKQCLAQSLGFSDEELSGVGLCLLPLDHEGEHEFTDGDEISVAAESEA
jgi:hypothetical protein